MSGTSLAVIVHAIMGLAITAAATVLLALHDMDTSTGIALYTAAIGLVSGSAATAIALKVPPAAK
jgi:hypothetical protein